MGKYNQEIVYYVYLFHVFLPKSPIVLIKKRSCAKNRDIQKSPLLIIREINEKVYNPKSSIL
jgi:hypothetical protein